MSIGKIGDLGALASAQAGLKEKGGVRDAALNKAFASQMEMTQSLLGEGSNGFGEGSSAGSFDVSMINDSMMLEALSTITRLMRNEAALPAQAVPSRPDAVQASPQAGIVNEANKYIPGALSAQFESGNAGVAAIGFDRVGGTSYGKYQIASKTGTMDDFLSYLDKEAPQWAQRLREAGPANTGSKEGGMPAEWKRIAAEQGVRFEELQHGFIEKQTYEPARNMILGQTGLDFNNAPPALREVLWSTSVQHGPTGAAKIFNRVIDKFVAGGRSEDFNATLIKGVYDVRQGQFGSSTQRVQAAVSNRLNTEKQLALDMLASTKLNRIV